jgi:hypothetical protein
MVLVPARRLLSEARRQTVEFLSWRQLLALLLYCRYAEERRECAGLGSNSASAFAVQTSGCGSVVKTREGRS